MAAQAADSPGGGVPANGPARPTATLPTPQLVRLSLYWLGLSSIFAGLTNILGNRLQFTGLVAPGTEGTTLFELTIGGSIVALLVQPTVGSLSDYTMTRWGRRKPYILIGSLLDVAFLYGIAVSNTVLAIAAFVILLQFSSNFAQGPFQGYVPDLVPAHQVGLASSLVGLMQVMGQVAGFTIGSIAAATHNYVAGTMALGVLELATMISVVLRVDDGKTTKSRNGRSWLSVAREAWAADVLREHSFLWLVGSRLFFLMGAAMLVVLGPFYLHQTFGLDESQSGTTFLIVVGFVLVANLLAVFPAGRLSDRVGRKRLLYVSFALGALGMVIVTIAPVLPVAYLGVVLFGLASGTFLAVDWALMTEIIPRASSGRYMGMSNVATASASIFALALGGTLMDAVDRGLGAGLGPRAAYGLAVVFFIIGGLLLRPVNEGRRPRPAGAL
jgi:MFS family permease